jgi:tetratricopeptide (TPR) repeat protein
VTRVRIVVAVVALAVAASTVALVAATADDPLGKAGEPPPLALELGGRASPERRALADAVALYEQGRLEEARAIFDRYRSPEARVGAAFARWPRGTLERLRADEDAAAARLHLGIALAALGDETEAQQVIRAVERLDPDSPYAVRAEDLLHPRFVPGIPTFVPGRPFTALPPGVRSGVALLRAGRRVSARRELRDAVRAAPDDPDVLTAAAVAEFDKDEPARAFSRLGPLTRRFPRAQVVRYHLGVLLLWIGALEEAKRQLAQTRALGPRSRFGRDAARLLERLGGGTS